jgi:integrase
MPSLQAGHARSCAGGKRWTPFESLNGCDCSPTFYVVVRDGARNHKERVGKNRRNAERALAKVQVAVNEDVYEPPAKIRFDAWGPRWREQLERKETTKDSYRSTVALAVEAFGEVQVGRIRPAHLGKLHALMKERQLSASTRAKHLRVLNACLAGAVEEGYAAKVVKLPKAQRPKPTKREAAYFTNDEVPRLFEQVPDGVYRVLFLTALKTGCRIGELSAAVWGDVDLVDGVLRVRRSFTDGHLSETTKNHERRSVDLTPDVVEMLAVWKNELDPADNMLVFPGETTSGYLDPTAVLRRELYPAMKRAGIPRELGQTGTLRSFHSFRHTYAKRALENGRRITWLSRHLGHSSLKVTTDVYGHFERDERKKEAELMAGVFGV